MHSTNNTEGDIILSKLKEVSFFKMFASDNAMMNKIASMCTQKHFTKGKTIIKEGESGDELYVILKGKIEILKKTLQKEAYTVNTMDADRGGVYVGELALIDNDSRSATVIANTDCDCLVISRDDFLRYGNQNPVAGLEITRMIASQLSKRLRKSNEDVITLFSALVDEISDNK